VSCRSVAVAVALVVVALGSACGARGREAPRGSPSATAVDLVAVTKVTDGDTIHVTYRGQDERVRLIGVDTPEVAWYGGHGECFGPQSARYTQSRLSGARVRVEFDVALRDRYGRLLAYVYLGDELFNLTLVRLGYATADPVPPDTRMAGAFSGAQADARAAGRGLWSACSR
jgi:micrococcal nuclease